MPQRLKINPQRCLGCRSCELACALENDGVMATGRSRIAVISFMESRAYGLPYHFPTTCRQCADAPCLTACPENALIRDRKGGHLLRIDAEQCTGCRLCIGACPYGVIGFDRTSRKARKCELCHGNPACVRICPSGAIQLEQVKQFYAKTSALQMEAFQILRRRNEPGQKRHS